MDIIITALLFILVLTILVVVHELGHFLVARKVGIRVEEFGIGFPPRLYGRKKGETEYTINALPLGGFVRMYGETSDGVSVKPGQAVADQDRAFFAKSKLARTGVLLAGVAANLVLGIILFTVVYTIGLPTFASKDPVITAVQANSPAAQAQLQAKDVITHLNGVAITKLEVPFSQLISQKAGQEITLTITRDGQPKDIHVIPRQHAPAGQGALGISLQAETYQNGVKRYPVWQAGIVGVQEAMGMAGAIVASLGTIFQSAVQQGGVPDGVAGPVGIAAVMGQARAAGWIFVVWLAGMISINLAVINVLPLPALDGGRLLFVIIEAIRGRQVDQKLEGIIHTVGMVALLLLIVLITFSDVTKLFR